ncbi:hypothetical protein L345_07515, partial [Ophiophagus hannah]
MGTNQGKKQPRTSLAIRTINQWNGLPPELVDAPTLEKKKENRGEERERGRKEERKEGVGRGKGRKEKGGKEERKKKKDEGRKERKKERKKEGKREGRREGRKEGRRKEGKGRRRRRRRLREEGKEGGRKKEEKERKREGRKIIKLFDTESKKIRTSWDGTYHCHPVAGRETPLSFRLECPPGSGKLAQSVLALRSLVTPIETLFAKCAFLRPAFSHLFPNPAF